jgi:hypothetical protein
MRANGDEVCRHSPGDGARFIRLGMAGVFLLFIHRRSVAVSAIDTPGDGARPGLLGETGERSFLSLLQHEKGGRVWQCIRMIRCSPT